MTRYVGNSQVLTVESSADTFTVLPYITETELDDGTAERVVFIGGEWNQVAYGLRNYSINSLFELDTTASTGNFAVARAAAAVSGTAPVRVRFYPQGTASGQRYFEIDAVIEAHDEGVAKNGKGVFRLIAEPHLQGTVEPDWYTVGS